MKWTGDIVSISGRRPLDSVRAAMVLLILAAVLLSAGAAQELGPGCAPDRAAVAHYADGTLANPTQEQRVTLVPCSVNTGWRTSEPSIAVTRNNTIVMQPAITPGGRAVGALRSTNLGKTWDFVDPLTEPYRSTAVDMVLWRDADTGRLFWNNSLSIFVHHPQRIDHSDDDGLTWKESFENVIQLFSHPAIFTGPPPQRLKLMMEGYPNVVYVVVGRYVCNGDPVLRSQCYTHVVRSFDGGTYFSPDVAVPFPDECTGPNVRPPGGYPMNGVVDKSGTAYFSYPPCQIPTVAISQDSGATWKSVVVAKDARAIGGGGVCMGMDAKGVLYVAWLDASDRMPRLSISRDGGLSWGAPIRIVAPGVRETAPVPAFSVADNGEVAITYYGSKNPPTPAPPPCKSETGSMSCPGYESQTWDTYVTVTFNALDQRPLFWTAMLNDPSQHTWYGFTSSILPKGGERPNAFAYMGSAMTETMALGPGEIPREAPFFGRFDYYGMTLGPDAMPFVAYAQECPDGKRFANNPNCPDTLTGRSMDGLIGMFGRLVRVESASKRAGSADSLPSERPARLKAAAR